MATLALTNTVLTATEGDGGGNRGVYEFRFELSGPSSSEVSFKYNVFGNTAFAGDDISDVDGTVRIPAGETSATVRILVRPDTLAEADEQFFLELYNIAGATFDGGADQLRGVGIIQDDDRGDTRPSLLVTDAEIVEGDDGQSEATFFVNLSRPLATSLEVPYQTVAGDATAGVDYTERTGVVTFAAGQTQAVVTVPVLGDTEAEPSETFFLLLDEPAGQITANGANGLAGRALIRDDDAGEGFATVITVQDAPSDNEGDGGGTRGVASFTVSLSQPASTQVTVDYRVVGDTAFTGDDVSGNRGSVTIQQGESTAVVDVLVIPDQLTEADERFVVEFFNPSGAVFADDAARLQASAVILDDDSGDTRPSLFVDDVSVLEGDIGAQEAVFTVSLSRPLDDAQSFTYATGDGTARAGVDYTAATGTLTFAPGQTEANVRVPILSDVLAEPAETFSLVVTPPGGQVTANGADGTTGLAQIRGDDGGDGFQAVLSIADSPVDTEGDGGGDRGRGIFFVTLSRPADNQVSFDYRVVGDNAEPGQDVASNSGTARIEAGETSAVIDPLFIPDTLAETDERWFLEVSNPSGAALAGGATTIRASSVVLDDDGSGRPPVVFVTQSTFGESTAGTARKQIELMLSRPLEQTLTFDVTAVDGTAVRGEDYALVDQTVQFAPGQTKAAIDLDILGGRPEEGNETFTVNATAREQNAVANPAASTTVTIANNPESTGQFDLLALSAAERATAFYVGYYGRGPEPGGLTFWTDFIRNELAQGRADFDVINEVSARFRDAEETIALFPFLDRSDQSPRDPSDIRDFVTDVYDNLFNRAPETAGLNFWAGEIGTRLENGQPISDIIITIIGAAQNADAFTIGNKIDVGESYGGSFTSAQFDERGEDFPDPRILIDLIDDTVDAIAGAQIQIADAGGDLSAFKGDPPGIVGSSDPLEF